jgi:hypothetical protein
VADLLVIVPSRGRPGSVASVVRCWDVTGGWEHADLMFAIDGDDPTVTWYRAALPHAAAAFEVPVWQPMVPKLNAAAVDRAADYFALAFMGDDHRPRTPGWAGAMLAALRDMGSGVVYGDDLLQGERLCTSWAMTSDVFRALGRMGPAPVEHMYCDNAVMTLASSAGCLRYLPEVVIEHCHPLAGKAEWDSGYARVNRAEQYQADRVAYDGWLAGQLALDV